MPKNNIKKNFNDALYWATAKQSKNKPYHITRTQEAILRKLIHYSTTNEKITYSNKIIAEHTYIDAEVLKKEIPKLAKIGFITSASIKINRQGKFKTRRTIYIDWDFIRDVLNDIPATKKIQVNESEPQLSVEIDSFIEELAVDEPITTKEEIEITLPKVELTQEKIDWLLPLMQNYDSNNTIEDILKLNQEQLLMAFYGENGLWEVDKNTLENKHQWRIYSVSGIKCEVYKSDAPDQKLSLNIHNLEALLEAKGMTFKDFNQSVYNDIMKNGLPKKQVFTQG